MAYKIKGSHIVALAILAGIGGWMYTGKIVIGGQSSGAGAVPIAEREAKRSAELFKVRYVTLQPQQRFEELVVRGKTAASAVVPVRAQVDGILMERLVKKGDAVQKNQIVCKVDVGARNARLAQAQAQVARAKAEYEANLRLKKKGFASTLKLNTLKASLDGARAGIAEAELNLERSTIRANAAGVVQDPVAQVGDMMNVGSTCVTLMQGDPMKFSGQISERDIDKVEIGTEAAVELVSGRITNGIVRYISPSADARTRTFLTEIEIPNTDGTIRDGVTARARIKLPPVEAYRLSPSWITLSDEGQIGVRIIDADNVVDFVKIELIAQTNQGFWAVGLKPGTRVITLGQEYVIVDEKVDAEIDVAALNGANQ